MKQEAIMKFEKYRYTINHAVDGRDFEFELELISPGVYAGMAGMDYHGVNVNINENESAGVQKRIGSIYLTFPVQKTGEDPHPQRMLEQEERLPIGQFRPEIPPPRQFTLFAQKQIVEAVEWFLHAQDSDIAQSCQLNHVSLMVK